MSSEIQRERMLNIGIVGMGGIGNKHAGCYIKHPHTQVVAVCDVDRDLADKAAKKHDTKAYYSVEEMLSADLDLDAVSIATAGPENGGHHYKPTMEVLAAGLPVLGEKPISNNITEAEEMVALAREKKLPYAINLNHRLRPRPFAPKSGSTRAASEFSTSST